MALKQPLRCLFISDIHLFHRRNPTQDIIANLRTYLKPFHKDEPLDLLVIGGDLFDRLAEFHTVEVHDACMWLACLLELCANRTIKLRILEGTPRHDWGQSRILRTLANILPIPVDCAYVNTLSIEHIAEWDLSILYIPDEWTDRADKTYVQVKETLAAHGLTQVDIAVMHGMFQYQLPTGVTMPSVHQEQDYLKIVRYLISVGHVHTPSQYERIHAQGSFDRLAHGEEEPKGGLWCTLYPDGHYAWLFRENKQAMIFKTISLKTMPIEKTLNYLERHVKDMPFGSHVRIRAKRDHPAMMALEAVRKAFPFLYWTKQSTDEDESVLPAETLTQEYYRGLTITSENLSLLLMERVQQRHTCPLEQQRIMVQLLEHVL
ncbi:MAG: hypothetical protein ACR2HF_08965 [Methylococcaceae bacterium]